MERLQSHRRCDFCNSFNPSEPQYRWTFVRQCIPSGTSLDLLEDLLMHPEWIACSCCHELVRTRNLTALLNANTDINTPQSRKYFTVLYSTLLENLSQN